MTNTRAERTPTVPKAGRYRLDPTRSSVTFRTRHVFGLAAVTGGMAVTGGDIDVDPATPHASVRVTISAASFDTGNSRRDRDVRSTRFLNTEQYPNISFRADSLTRADDRWSVTGELTVREVTQAVTLAVESVAPAIDGFRARATTRIDRYAFGLTAAKGIAARYLDIDVTVAATPIVTRPGWKS